MKDKKTNPKVLIQFPNLLLVPIFSVICIIIKLCNGVDWNWINVILIGPALMYFGWCLGYVALAFFSIMLIEFTKDKEND